MRSTSRTAHSATRVNPSRLISANCGTSRATRPRRWRRGVRGLPGRAHPEGARRGGRDHRVTHRDRRDPVDRFGDQTVVVDARSLDDARQLRRPDQPFGGLAARHHVHELRHVPRLVVDGEHPARGPGPARTSAGRVAAACRRRHDARPRQRDRRGRRSAGRATSAWRQCSAARAIVNGDVRVRREHPRDGIDDLLAGQPRRPPRRFAVGGVSCLTAGPAP